MLIVSQSEFDRIRRGEQTAVLLLGESEIQPEWGPQPIRVGYKGETGHVRVVAKRVTHMGQLTEVDVRLLASPSLAAYRSSWNQRHPVCNRWHVNRVCTLVRLVYSGPPAVQEQSTLSL